MAADEALASADWHFADVICGHAHCKNFPIDLDVGEEMFAKIDRIRPQGQQARRAPATDLRHHEVFQQETGWAACKCRSRLLSVPPPNIR
ncbi:MAG TPA: hypothetical protein VNS33_09325 [Bradyrhizobium sp.]|jgi:hypothetical protein|nr:hypothetical protein [Bradyrhizobium sp.]